MQNLITRPRRSDVTPWRGEFDDFFGRFFGRESQSHLPNVFRTMNMPAVDVAETDQSWNISVQLPGLKEKDIQVQLTGRQLVVSAERKWEDEKKGKEFLRVESQYGSFLRTIELPENARVEPDAIQAAYRDGVLEILIPKTEPTPAARIPVKAG